MARRPLYTRLAISVILILQIIPLLLFPPSLYGGGSQMWWLPALLVFMVVVADVQLFVRPSTSPAPWYLLSFAQGVNIISRLMMLWANSSRAQGETVLLDWGYILLNVVAVALSVLLLVYLARPPVREGLLPA